jgi:ribosomal protein S18 acetylase RimI-like enzyme
MINQQSPQPAAQEPSPASGAAPFIIRPQLDADIAVIVAFSLRAWKPVFESMARVLGPRLNRLVYPDWAAGQARAVEEVCRDETMTVWVAEAGARPAGFVAVALRSDPGSAEIEMIAVDPDQQNRGIGSALLACALDQISAAGVKLVQLGTGGDPGHAPARRTYEKAGFTPLPLVRYYKELPAVRED